MFGRDAERMMQMWVELLNEIEGSPLRNPMWERVPDSIKRQQIGSVEDRDTEIVLSADLPGIEKKDIDLSVDHNSIAFKAQTENRDYDFAQTFMFDLNPEEVKATFNNGVLDVVVAKNEESKGKAIEIE